MPGGIYAAYLVTRCSYAGVFVLSRIKLILMILGFSFHVICPGALAMLRGCCYSAIAIPKRIISTHTVI